MPRYISKGGNSVVIGSEVWTDEDGQPEIKVDVYGPDKVLCSNVPLSFLVEALNNLTGVTASYDPPRKNIREQVEALPVGTMFLIKELSNYRGVKVTDTHYITLSNGQPYASPIYTMRTDVDHEVVVEFDPNNADETSY